MSATRKVYFGAVWGIICIGLFAINDIIAIIGPLAYVLYLCLDSKIQLCRTFVGKIIKSKKLEH